MTADSRKTLSDLAKELDNNDIELEHAMAAFTDMLLSLRKYKAGLSVDKTLHGADRVQARKDYLHDKGAMPLAEMMMGAMMPMPGIDGMTEMLGTQNLSSIEHFGLDVAVEGAQETHEGNHAKKALSPEMKALRQAHATMYAQEMQEREAARLERREIRDTVDQLHKMMGDLERQMRLDAKSDKRRKISQAFRVNKRCVVTPDAANMTEAFMKHKHELVDLAPSVGQEAA